MTADQVRKVFLEDFGQPPEDLYYNFDASKPLKSGSIGSVFLTKKAIEKDGATVLLPMVVKVARHNLEREFAMGSLAIELMLISSQYWAPHSKLKPFLKSMAEQIKEFTKGFEQELDFSNEARVQQRFYERALRSELWSVPKVYGASGRVIEMEFLDEVKPISQALVGHPDRPKRRKQIANHFLYVVLEHLLIHQEFHGDLHAGNLLVDEESHLYLIDWGNSVDMHGKWGNVFQYISAALCADLEALTDVLIAMSTTPAKHEARREDLRSALEETLSKRDVKALQPWQLHEFYKEGTQGLSQRVSMAIQLLSNTYQLGITIQSDYLHLSRSVTAMLATYANLYSDEKRLTVTKELIEGLLRAPGYYGFSNIVKDLYGYAQSKMSKGSLKVPKLRMELVPLNQGIAKI